MSAHGVAGPRSDSGAASQRGAHARDAGDTRLAARPDPRRQDQPSRPDLRVVERAPRPGQRGRRRFRLAIAAGSAFFAAIVFGLVGLHVVLAQNQFRLDRLNASTATEETRYQRLRLEVDQLESPQRIVATAENKLHMVVAPGVSYLTPSRSVVLTPSPATRHESSQATSPSTTPPSGGQGPADWAAVKPQLAAGQ
jgi:hypothetical protein